ncbi:hypothetical protein LOTGIDRAFT_206064 [Lottia gigantea]|uniref:NAD-dependent protein deacetylase n=1 Tax=Lottia gigantea TaxID=225164 RepID=V4B5Z2_LOTGI|nr:hypothetical protein LOTGIDRAFT_206064 [Lottia gigantea]ESP02931.1 hypothetical protein LOTGIDRAFT_206064 [Lottia gigantea]
MAESKENKDNNQTSETEKDETESSGLDWLAGYMKQSLGLTENKAVKVLDEVSFEGIAKYIKEKKCKNIITMAGAGISTSAGIPDFRSKGTGLYDNLEKYNLPCPEAIFTIDYFKENPEPFFVLAKELFPGKFKPTPCHYFIRLLHDKGLLLRHYSQNIDTLERVAGLPGEKLVEAHGTFHSSHCLICDKQYTLEWIKEKIFKDTIPKCDETECDGVVKPDIVFFGEALPKRFAECYAEDFGKCDMLIVMGTSLKVQPFASLTSRVPVECPRLYINLEKTDDSSGNFLAALMFGHNFDFDSEDCYRDVFKQSTCDDGCLELADKIGWKKELDKLIKEEYSKIDKENKTADKSPAKSPSTASGSKTKSKQS